MKRTNKSKRMIVAVLVITLLCSFQGVYAEGILPTLSEAVGVAMPSLGEALQCYPDSETENEDGSITELYTNISESDFNTFSMYLETQGAELAEYQVDGGVLTAKILASGSSFSLRFDSQTGDATITYPSGTFDDRVKNAKTHFNTTRKLLEEKKMDEAIKELLVIPQYDEYPPVKDLLQNEQNLAITVAHEAKIAPFRKIDNVVTFGRFEQDADTTNGPEKVEWMVLDYNAKDHKVLLLSVYGLDLEENWFDSRKSEYTWEKSVVRKWLSNEFLKSAFTEDEREAILTTTVDNSASQGYSREEYAGKNTKDQVFVLSYAEAHRYLGLEYEESNERAAAEPSAYANSQVESKRDKRFTYTSDIEDDWWLRSPDYDRYSGGYVSGNGGFWNSGNSGLALIRPALWLDLESKYFY